MSACPSVYLSVSLYACLCESMYSKHLFSVHPFTCIHECLFQRVNVSACPPVSPPYLSSRLSVTLSFVCFLFVRLSVRSSVHPPVLSSVRQSESKCLSLIHVCMSVIILISISMFILECVCLCTRVYGRCVHAYELSVCPCIHPADHYLVFQPI